MCPYHQWTYDLTGKLIYAEHMGEDFDPSGRGLKRVHVESVAGLIFVCLAENPPQDFAQMREAMERYVGPHRLTDCKIAVQDEIVEAGNWKLVMENNRECYHCVSNHPELTISLYEYGFGYQPSPSNMEQVQAFRDLIGREHARWEAAGLQSGGSGITPLMSMSRSFHDLGEDRDVVFVHSARTPADIIFRRELGLLAGNQPGFRTAFVCEGRGGEAEWAAPTGYLDLQLLARIAPDFAEREVFCCGPAPYMAAVRALLTEGGFDMARHHEESFSFADLPGEPADEDSASAGVSACEAVGFSVEFSKSGHTVACAPGQKVLEAARVAGLRLPSSCAKGMCGTCKSRLVSGEVHMEHGGGIRQREIDQGYILPCCSTPLSDLVIER
ncbi:Ring hydroxylating alpha subunit (catalytic domain) [Aromatoleum tolulyticum]|uniref:Ring hydroxylating alpha subunit (Catalytic domain) n=1 Tax=Aromatoleum tolulyticum TaxID=34027 RepID=A0A1N6Y3E1_9RHOO|nr:2Fe-2S iron-sulfur cluster-binding protein [Aromatoleum tolulyticum]SIR09063.1 Ring hydroxylating alpha subunit (catalytic domain) [Aromatoleum tolulyticum]